MDTTGPGPHPIPDDLLELPVQGRNLAGATFGENLWMVPTLIVFLRHLGCGTAKRDIADLVKRARGHDLFPPVLLVHTGTPADGDRFLAKRWPEARAIADPEKKLYDTFELGRTSGASLGTKLGGLFGKVIGDPSVLGGNFVAKDGAIVWSHKHAESGEPRRFAEVSQELEVGFEQ